MSYIVVGESDELVCHASFHVETHFPSSRYNTLLFYKGLSSWKYCV